MGYYKLNEQRKMVSGDSVVPETLTPQQMHRSRVSEWLEWEGAVKDGLEWLVRSREEHLRNWLQDYFHAGKRFSDTRHKIYKDG